MRHKYICKFKVTGSGHFPIDMLRYDRAFPATETDSGRIHNQLTCLDMLSGEIIIALARYTEGKNNVRVGFRGSDMPTTGRWESFGWRVSEVTFEKLS